MLMIFCFLIFLFLLIISSTWELIPNFAGESSTIKNFLELILKIFFSVSASIDRSFKPYNEHLDFFLLLHVSSAFIDFSIEVPVQIIASSLLFC